MMRKGNRLRRADLAVDPIAQFEMWYQTAVATGLKNPNAMTLATASADGRPSARMVLLKGYDHRGFRFYTNYHSRKGRELAENRWAALVFYWPPLDQQVRVTGTVSRLSPTESDAYFSSRPRGSQLGAVASPQSEVLADREELTTAVQQAAEQYGTTPIPRPPDWGGYQLSPHQIEFWQGDRDRLHDRFLYTHQEDGSWLIERLAP